jgi:hypothetical protein
MGFAPSTWGEGVEKGPKRASQAPPSADNEPTLCAEAPAPFVPQSLVVGGGGGSSGRGALARALSGDGGGAPGEAKQPTAHGLGHMHTLCLLLTAATVATWGG